ncbi:MAG: hypothetical protein ACYTHN_24015, partial [Planctomycetota bacterium]
MKRHGIWIFGLILWGSTLSAQEGAPPIPRECDLAAQAVPLALTRQVVDQGVRIRVTLRIERLIFGKIPEGRKVILEAPAPLPEAWHPLVLGIAGQREARFGVFLKALAPAGRRQDPLFAAAAAEASVRVLPPEEEVKMREAVETAVRNAVRDLDSQEYAEREEADKTLRRMGLASVTALREVLKNNPSPEVALRANNILSSLPRLPSGGTRYVIHQPD